MLKTTESKSNKNIQEYARRIHLVQDYMESHLDTPLTLDTLSNVAGFSKYHFSRIFHGIIREPLAHYVNRIRMERALFFLAHRRDKSVTDIAFEVGIQDSAVFSRAFKNYYGISPSAYRRNYSKNCKESFLLSSYNKEAAVQHPSLGTFKMDGEITLENLEKKRIFYVRHTGTYATLEKEYENLIGVLFAQAEKQKVYPDKDNWVLAMYHDNPEFGVEHQFRTSLCLTIPDGIVPLEDGILGLMDLEGGMYAVGHFRITQEQYGDAWDHMYREWITGSGYVPRDQAPFEVYRHIPENGSRIHEVDIYVPVEPISF